MELSILRLEVAKTYQKFYKLLICNYFKLVR